ncbi:MAG TPA: HAD family phosphatase [Streptosporangiaceae bacterium]|nr:HAD family phosphatase [Streptosporangiaceae bacterium]
MRSIPAEPAGPSRADLMGVLFDMDGLLVDSEPLWFEVESSVMARLGGSWDAADQQALVGGSLARSLDYLLAKAARPVAREIVAGWMLGGMVELVSSRMLSVMPGARELLNEVAEAGVPYALVTSSERPVMEAVLDQLDVRFPVTVCGDDVSNSKPDPEPYLMAAAKLGADPRHCVAIEDSPNGVASAEAAGCLMIAVPSMVPIPAENGRLVVGSLREVSLDRLYDLAATR